MIKVGGSLVSRAERSRLDLLLALSLLGVAIGGYLSWVALDDGVEAACSGVGDCHAVQDSDYAEVAGIPVALLGLAMYGGLAVLFATRRLGPWRAQPAAEPRVLPVWCFALAISGVLFSAYLTYVELFVIDAICIWCVASAVLIAAIALLAAPDLRQRERERSARP